MSLLKHAVLRQVAYAHSVRAFIRDLLKVFIPGRWINRAMQTRVHAANKKALLAKQDAHLRAENARWRVHHAHRRVKNAHSNCKFQTKFSGIV
jgi:hypothetical protein